MSWGDVLQGSGIPGINETMEDIFSEVFKSYMFRCEDFPRINWMK